MVGKVGEFVVEQPSVSLLDSARARGRGAKAWLLAYYQRHMFEPGLIALFFNQFYIIRRGLHRGVGRYCGELEGGHLLDLGCGETPYKHMFDVDTYVGLEIGENRHDHTETEIDIVYDGEALPFEDEAIDHVFSSEVFEHIFNLEDILDEIHRVLKPDGNLLITLPFAWDEHEAPVDFARYTSFGIADLLERHGFELVDLHKTTNYVETVFQMLTAYLYQVVFPSHRVLRSALTPFAIAPLNIAGVVLGKILPDNGAYYHNNVVLARKA